jgi:hypothetical protein
MWQVRVLFIGIALIFGLDVMVRDGIVMNPSWRRISAGLSHVALPVGALVFLWMGVVMRPLSELTGVRPGKGFVVQKEAIDDWAPSV